MVRGLLTAFCITIVWVWNVTIYLVDDVATQMEEICVPTSTTACATTDLHPVPGGLIYETVASNFVIIFLIPSVLCELVVRNLSKHLNVCKYLVAVTILLKQLPL